LAVGGIDRRPPISATAERPQLPEDGELRCANHPNTPTRLRCGRCGKPICTRCANTTSVGLRCPECARGPKPVMYQTDTTILGRALGAGLAAALVIGVAWGLLNQAGLGRTELNWDFWFSLIVGFGIAESVSLAAKRRRGPNLQLLAIASVLLAYGISRVVIALLSTRSFIANEGYLLLLAIGEPVDFIVGPGDYPVLFRLLIVHMLFLALGCLIARWRFR
jgi:hypothetical protein